MFVIWGFRDTVKILGKSRDSYHCSHCGNSSSYWVYRKRKWFTLFWIPVFLCKTEYYIACPACKYGQMISKNESRYQLENAAQITEKEGSEA